MRGDIVAKLAEFLQSEAEKRLNRAAETQTKRNEWCMAVGRLMTTLKQWVDESDKESHVLESKLERVRLAEEELGTYEAQELLITLDPREVRVTPIARNVVGGVDAGGIYVRADGRVDITDGARKYILYRIAATDSWRVVDPDTYTVGEFNRAAFESILQSLLA
jgi:hypothetical protein